MIHGGIRGVYSPRELIMRAFYYINSSCRMGSAAINRSEGHILLHVIVSELLWLKRLRQSLKS